MDSRPREVLSKLLDKYSENLINDTPRLRGLLLDYCGGYRAEVNLLMQALDVDIPKMLLNSNPDIPLGLLETNQAVEKVVMKH
jgi:hypothetical protein